MRKLYLEKNVYDAACERIGFVFDEFETILISFSGGKDSGVVLNLCIDEARKRNRKIHVMFIDLEAFYRHTIEFIHRMIESNRDVIIPHWICLPMVSDNSSSFLEPTWRWWDPDKEPLWVRPMPEYEYVVNLRNHDYPFYHPEITFEQFVVHIADHIAGGGKVASLLGLRATESLNRYRTMVRDDKATYMGRNWSTLIKRQAYSFFPIYDWEVEDIWAYNGRFGKDYNHLYDLFYKAGLTLSQMRVDEPFGDTAKGGLNLFRIIEPDTWARVCNRVSGANFGNIYSKEKINKSNYTLPSGHTWKSFTLFLLDTLPDDIAQHYRAMFDKFTRYWMEVGSPESEEAIRILESSCGDSIVNTHTTSNRGHGDKEVIRFTEIVDSLPELDGKEDILTWRRLAMCIIKNDYYGRTLSFSIPKRNQQWVDAIKRKYRSVMKGGEG
jgi:predicted phosphoadenosine phosphosulfate sulfurtransferase